MASHSLCSIPNCGKPAYVRGWCGPHYKRWYRHGDPLGGGTPTGVPAAFIEFTLTMDTDFCINWPYSTNTGRGQININGRPQFVSRIVCERVHGPAPTSAHEAAHNCGNGHEGCINWRHLEWKTHAENVADTLIHGTRNFGERNGAAKLTIPDVHEIRRRWSSGETQQDIAASFDISRQTVSDIVRRKRWGWLE